MTKTALDTLIETIQRWGVDIVFGAGNCSCQAFAQRREGLRFIEVCHEEAAALMACAYAKYSGRLGACLACSEPGAARLLTGLYNAKLDQAPVIAITLQTRPPFEVNQRGIHTARLFADAASFNEQVNGAEEVETLTHEACRSALNRRTVSHLCLPAECRGWQAAAGTHQSAGSVQRWKTTPGESDIRRAADILNRGKRIAILAGRGALGAREEILSLAETLGAPIVKTLLGKGVLADEHPLCLGALGPLGTAPAEEAMRNCDTLLIIGTSFRYRNYLPPPENAVGVQIDDTPEMISANFPAQIGLLGDARATLQVLLPHIVYHSDRSFLAARQKEMTAWCKAMAEEERRAGAPIRAQQAACIISSLAGPDAAISVDLDLNTTRAARPVTLHDKQLFGCPGALAAAGSALAYAIAAQLACPQRRSIAVQEEAGFLALMPEFVTAVRYSLPVVAAILKDSRRTEEASRTIDFAAYALACGGAGFRAADGDQLRAVMLEALHDTRPSIIEIRIDSGTPAWVPEFCAQGNPGVAAASAFKTIPGSAG